LPYERPKHFTMHNQPFHSKSYPTPRPQQFQHRHSYIWNGNELLPNPLQRIGALCSQHVSTGYGTTVTDIQNNIATLAASQQAFPMWNRKRQASSDPDDTVTSDKKMSDQPKEHNDNKRARQAHSLDKSKRYFKRQDGSFVSAFGSFIPIDESDYDDCSSDISSCSSFEYEEEDNQLLECYGDTLITPELLLFAETVKSADQDFEKPKSNNGVILCSLSSRNEPKQATITTVSDNLSLQQLQLRSNISDVVLTDADVLLGRGNNCTAHPGNERFRKIVDETKEIYFAKGDSKKGKNAVSLSIVDSIHSYGGRFLEVISTNPVQYSIVDKKRAQKKCSQRLREPQRRKKLVALM